MTFAPLIWPILIAILLLWGIGGFLSWAVGVRGFWAVAAAPAFAMTLMGGTAVVASWMGVPWSVLPVVVMSGLVGLVILIARRRIPSRRPAPRRPFDWWLAIALAATGAVVTVRILQVVQAPENISQTFDNIFHLNGVRFALSEGDASSLRLGYMTSPDGSLPFYPAAWHALCALVVQLSGASIPIAVNAVVITVSAVVWPAAAVLLARTLFGRSTPITVAAALVSGALPAFPILLMDYGVLYPLQLSLALLPIALAATLRVLRIVPQASPRGTGWWILILVGVIPGLALAHPGGFVAWLALGVPMALVRLVQSLRTAVTLRRRLVIVLAAGVYLAVGAVLVRVLRPPLEARQWPTRATEVEAVSQVLTVSLWYAVPAVVAALCVAVGVVWSLVDRTPRSLVALGMYAIGAVLFVTVAAIDQWTVRDSLTGSWYNNLPRLAAILAVAMVPIGAYGAGRSYVAVLSRKRVRSSVGSWRPFARTSVGALAALTLLVGLQFDGAMSSAVEEASAGYRVGEESALLSSDEYALLVRIDDEVPAGVAIAGSAWTGASLASAISDRPVTMPHTLMFTSEELERINEGLDSAQRGDAVCAAIDELGVGFVLDFGDREVHGGAHAMPGMADLATSPAVELVDQEGDARLYRVIACE